MSTKEIHENHEPAPPLGLGSSEGLGAARVGWRVRFAEERQAYTVQARGPRYLVCSKPFNARRTTLYTVVDLAKQIRGTENLVFPAGAETREQCERMRDRLEGIDNHMMSTEVSYRNQVPLRVAAVFSAERRTERGAVTQSPGRAADVAPPFRVTGSAVVPKRKECDEPAHLGREQGPRQGAMQDRARVVAVPEHARSRWRHQHDPRALLLHGLRAPRGARL